LRMALALPRQVHAKGASSLWSMVAWN
jgi:hypothetical protein